MAETTLHPRTAWEPYEPTKAEPWNLQRVGHLYRRAAFGAGWDELQAGLKAGPAGALDTLFSLGQAKDDDADLMKQRADSIARVNNDAQLAPWWLYRLLYGTDPVREKLTLFWHNHFATSNRKVLNARFMLGQYNLMREHALGSFRTLLHALSLDPAMLVWLDTRDSKKGNPNENYARELMELFSLGIGNYTEKDIREAARAFTGWELPGLQPTFNAKEHDSGTKTVFSKSGTFREKEIVDLCLDHPACAYFLVGKLFRYYISETLPASKELLQPLADQYRKSGYQTAAVLKTMLRSKLFYSAEAYRGRLKSPVEFAVGLVRPFRVLEALNKTPTDRFGRVGTTPLAEELEKLGQHLFHPPSVKGWDHGPSWLNGQTLLYRQNLALNLTSTRSKFGTGLDPALLAKHYQKTSDADLVAWFADVYLDGVLSADAKQQMLAYLATSKQQKLPVFLTAADQEARRVQTLCYLVLAQPEFQLA